MAVSVRRTNVGLYRLLVVMLFHFSLQATAAGRKTHRMQEMVRHCPDDMFDDQVRGARNGTLNCRPCSQCLPGFGVRRMCSWTVDTQCSPCPTGQYSESPSLWGNCLSCRQCEKNQLVSQACTAVSNTVCIHSCPRGHFYNPFDSDCLPCSPCHRGPDEGDTATPIKACEEAGMAPEMQCWPPPSMSRPVFDYPSYFYDDTSEFDDISNHGNAETSQSTSSLTDNPSPATTPFPHLMKNTDDGNASLTIDEDTAQLYTIILISLLCIVGLCLILSVGVIFCLNRMMRQTSIGFHHKEKNGYQCISEKTANLLVRGTSYV